MLVAIVAFIAYRATRPRERVRGAKGRFFGSTMWQGYFVEVRHPRRRPLHRRAARPRVRAADPRRRARRQRARRSTSRSPPGSARRSRACRRARIENAIYLVAMLKILISFVWMITISLNLDHGRRLAPLHRVLQHLVQARVRRPHRAGRGQAADVRRQAGHPRRHRGPRRGRHARRRLGRGLHLEGHPRLHDLHRVRPLPVAVPGLEHREAALPQAADHGPARPRATRRRRTSWPTRSERAALLAATCSTEAERPLVGDTGDDWFYMPENGAAVIDPDVLWSCITCGACVQQCPVDIEHVDHIIDMRRYQVLVESNFPAELNGLFKGLENKGNPWNMSPTARMDWAKGLRFDVKVVGEDVESLDEVDWLFWVGCAGAYEDRAKKTTRAVAELLDMAGVSFGVLGNGETCTGDPARRAGNEFVFQGLAAAERRDLQGVQGQEGRLDLRRTASTRSRTSTSDFGIELEVVHHTQLLNRLVREGKLTPVTDGAGAAKRSITYHDPCYLGRHNQVYAPPRELLQVLPGAEFVEMERNSERSFCCGAGGARMWMEENIGERINVNRTKEAVGTGADQIAVGCPFCRVMLSDGLTAAAGQGRGPRGGRGPRRRADAARLGEGRVATQAAKPAAAAAGRLRRPLRRPPRSARPRTDGRGDQGRARGRRRHPDRGHGHRDRGRRPGRQGLRRARRSSTPRRPEEPAATAAPTRRAAGGEGRRASVAGGSLFDLGGDEPGEGRAAGGGRARAGRPRPSRSRARAEAAEAETDARCGRLALRPRRRRAGREGRAGEGRAPPTKSAPANAEPTRAGRPRKPAKTGDETGGHLSCGGSLFDLEAPAEPAAPARADSSVAAAEPREAAEPAEAAASRAVADEAEAEAEEARRTRPRPRDPATPRRRHRRTRSRRVARCSTWPHPSRPRPRPSRLPPEPEPEPAAAPSPRAPRRPSPSLPPSRARAGYPRGHRHHPGTGDRPRRARSRTAARSSTSPRRSPPRPPPSRPRPHRSPRPSRRWSPSRRSSTRSTPGRRPPRRPPTTRSPTTSPPARRPRASRPVRRSVPPRPRLPAVRPRTRPRRTRAPVGPETPSRVDARGARGRRTTASTEPSGSEPAAPDRPLPAGGAGPQGPAGQQRRGPRAEDRRRHQRVGIALRPLRSGSA